MGRTHEILVMIRIRIRILDLRSQKTTGQIFMKFSGEVDMGHGTNPLNFGDDPDLDPDSRSL